MHIVAELILVVVITVMSGLAQVPIIIIMGVALLLLRQSILRRHQCIPHPPLRFILRRLQW